MIVGAFLLALSLPLSSTAASGQRFSDVPPTKHFAEAVNKLAEREIIGGYPDGTFKPSNSITRGQAAAIIAKMIKLDTSKVKNPKFTDVRTSNGYYKAIAALAEKSIISGYGDGRFGPNDPITRGQMASILVKAFDLPRYDFTSHTNPFVDVRKGTGHDPSILTIRRLGITTGTSLDRFSPNISITRGQAAKMLRATEEAKSQIITVRASDYGWEKFNMNNSNHKEDALFNAVKTVNATDRTEERIHLVPLKEGSGTFKVALVYSGNPDEKYYRKYYVHIKEVDGKLKLTLEETQDFLTTSAVITVKDKKRVEKISLSTMDGKELSDDVAFTTCTYYGIQVCPEKDQVDSEGNYKNLIIPIEKTGQYIATIRYVDGEDVRYGIEAISSRPSFYYNIQTVEERLEAFVDLGASYDIGKSVLPKGAEQIAEITRDPGTNVFRAVPKKEGAFDIRFPDNQKVDLIGIGVNVQKIGSIFQINMYEDTDLHM